MPDNDHQSITHQSITPESITIGQTAAGDPVTVPESHLAQHALVFGGSGYGKTFLSYVLLQGQMQQGASLVALDPKRTTLRRLRGLCHTVGIPPENVVTIDATVPEAGPGMNPLGGLDGGNPAESSALLMDLFQKIGALTGDRIKAFLTHAVRVAAWHGLPLTEVLRLLTDSGFRRRTLSAPPPHPVTPLYQQSVSYFRYRFPTFKEAERESTVLSIETKFTELLANDLFLRMFGATENTVDFDALFRRPGAVLVSLEPGGGLTEVGAGLLAALTVHFLFAAARRQPADVSVVPVVPVVLAVDEIRKLSGFLEEGIRDVVNMAREARIRLLVAGQHPGQLPEGVRADLMVSSAVKAYFNPGDEPTDTAARSLAKAARPVTELPTNEMPAEAPPSVPPYKSKLFARHIEQPTDGPVLVKPDCPPLGEPLYVDPNAPSLALRRFMGYASQYVPPLTLEDGRLATTLFAQAPRDHGYVVWREGVGYAYIRPPEMLALPAPKEKPRETDWSAVLTRLGQGEAVIVVGGEAPVVTGIVWVTPCPDAPPDYIARSQEANRAPDPAPPAANTSSDTLDTLDTSDTDVAPNAEESVSRPSQSVRSSRSSRTSRAADNTAGTADSPRTTGSPSPKRVPSGRQRNDRFEDPMEDDDESI